MKKITLSADETLIEAAHARAREEQTTLNEQFRRWLTVYVHQRDRALQYDAAISELRGKLRVGESPSREGMSER
ncbi:unnamed protein product [Chondrus crispus]|uniref:Uncharacterized protein n=1 Tax=Chondrus crispus TaxID=2769 RepID=R7Q8V8_CHOCR|nr:unnamed protein product [Chondrus crispus]CDF34469.1 unnamed protein product [Chondrus crispus]|eukprot:XP_005714288.1 unnamed protein product [Chondrus crispus]